MADHQDVVEQLEAIGELLTDRAIEVLRAAIEDGSGERPAEERELLKAQRAVDRAARILRALGDR